MAVHKCNHESDFGEIKTQLADLNKIVKGNGQQGIQTTVTELNKTVQVLTNTVEELRKVISGFSKFQTEIESEVRAEEKQKADARVKQTNKQWGWGTAIGVVGLITGILIAILT